MISSQARYDHFDTLPYSVLRVESTEKIGFRVKSAITALILLRIHYEKENCIVNYIKVMRFCQVEN